MKFTLGAPENHREQHEQNPAPKVFKKKKAVISVFVAKR